MNTSDPISAPTCRILQIVADGKPGGGSTVVLGLTAGLVGRGLSVGVACDRDSYVAQTAGKIGATAFGLDFFHRPDRAARQLREIIRSHQPDLIHVHGGRAAFVLAIARAGLKPVPTCYTVHGYHFLKKSRLKRYAGAAAERFASMAAGSIVFVCDYDRKLSHAWRVAAKSKSRRVIYNGIEPVTQTVSVAPQDRDPRKVVYLGRLTYQKDPHLLVQIAQRLAGDGFEVKLIAGGDMEQEVRSLIEAAKLGERVSVTGSLPRSAALDAIGDAAFLLLPSRWEGFPMAVLEAACLGLVPVAANMSGIPEMIDDGVTGRLITERDPEPYFRAIKELAADHPKRRDIAGRTARAVQEKFTDSNMLAQYLDAYQSLLGRSLTQ